MKVHGTSLNTGLLGGRSSLRNKAVQLAALFFLWTLPVYAGGQGEDELTAEERAQRLIQQAAEEILSDNPDYRAATVDLVEAVETDEEQLDAAEPLFSEIRTANEEYVALGEGLRDLLSQLVDPELSEQDFLRLGDEADRIIDAMEEIIPNPNPTDARIIDDFRYTLQLSRDKVAFRNLMDRALPLLEPGSVAEAVTIYLTGFDLQRPNFEDRSYGEIGEAIVSGRELMRSQAGALGVAEEALLGSAAAVVEAFEQGQTDRVTDAFETFTRQFEVASGFALELQRASDELNSQLIALNALWAEQQDPRIDWHLVFLTRFSDGRPGGVESEGILHGAGLLIEESYLSVSEPAETVGRAHYDEVTARIAQPDWVPSDEPGLLARSIQALSVVTEGSAIRIGASTDQTDVGAFLAPFDLDERAALFPLRVIIDSAGDLVALSEAYDRALAAYERFGSSATSLTAKREDIRAEVEAVNTLTTAWDGSVETYGEVADELFTGEAAALSSNHQTLLGSWLSVMKEYEIEIIDDIAVIEMRALQRRYDGSTGIVGDVDDSEELIEGVLDDGVAKRDPVTAQRDLQASLSIANALERDVVQFSTTYRSEIDYVASDDRILDHVAAGDTLAQRVRSTAARIRTLNTTAARLEREARSAEDRAEELIRETETALESQQVSVAETLFDDFIATYTESLSAWWRDSLANRWEVEQTRLSGLIVDVRKQVIVRDVGERLDIAETYVQQERYAEAQVELQDALEQWRKVFAIDNPTLVRLLTIVNAALASAGARELSESDPNYATLSKWLNEARLAYQTAVIEKIDDPEADVEESLAAAESLLDLLFAEQPQNFSARLLKVLIDILREGDNLDRLLRNRLDELNKQLRDDPDDAPLVLTRALAIRDVFTEVATDPVDPRLTGELEELIANLDRQLNPIILTAPDDRSRDQAADLINRALALGDPTRMSQANLTSYLSWLSDAIGLDPENDRAQTLYNDALLTAENAPTVKPMSPESRQLFEAAQDDYAAARTADAIRKINQLWQNTPNRLDPDLVSFRENLKSEFPDLIQD